ncbi:MAG: cupin domain-containing protein [Parasphingorhabdus sp.]|nr:cupin domain-containing protein [Parasphingorhabdus sp.]
MTPFHFDPERNILLQLRGQKVMTIFPADDEEIADGAAHEAFHLGKHHRNLPWHDKFQNRGTEFVLNAGEAVYVPVKAPHFVRNGDAVSISLSITWRSEWSYAEAEARALNHRLRKLGLNPAPPERYPARNTAKALANRAARRLGL